MTEQIKSAIEWCEEFEIAHNLKDGEKNNFRYAIRSLQSWEEVLQELENMREIIWQNTDNDARIIRANAWDKIEILNKASDIINQKLAEIEE